MIAQVLHFAQEVLRTAGHRNTEKRRTRRMLAVGTTRTEQAHGIGINRQQRLRLNRAPAIRAFDLFSKIKYLISDLLAFAVTSFAPIRKSPIGSDEILPN